MKNRLSLSLLVLLFFAVGYGVAASTGSAAEPESREEIARALVAREKAAFDAWQRKDKEFFTSYLADDATAFGPMSPYLETDPKENFLPKFEQMTERYKMLDWQMYNPRVQTYGDTAILTYNSMATVDFGGRPMQYTSKVTEVFVRQGNVWRVVHGHESVNSGAQQ
jgi:ketosteroid isomerase-like protein